MGEHQHDMSHPALEGTHHGGSAANMLHNRRKDIEARLEAGEWKGKELTTYQEMLFTSMVAELRKLEEAARWLETSREYPYFYERDWGSVYFGEAFTDEGDDRPGYKEIGLKLDAIDPDGALLKIHFTEDGTWEVFTPGHMPSAGSDVKHSDYRESSWVGVFEGWTKDKQTIVEWGPGHSYVVIESSNVEEDMFRIWIMEDDHHEIVFEVIGYFFDSDRYTAALEHLKNTGDISRLHREGQKRIN